MANRTQQLVPVAQLLGLSGAAALSGYIASFSFIGVPACQMAPTDLMAKQWSRIYHIGKDSVPPLALCCSTVFGFLAYATRKLDGRFGVSPTTLYTSAAVLAPCVAPYTFAVMWNGVQALEAKAAGASDAPSATESEALVKSWSKQNLHRALIVGMAALLSAVATLS